MPANDHPITEVVPCERPFSFFSEAHRYEGDTHNHALHRTFSLARKLRAKTMVREPLSEPTPTEEAEAVSSRFGSSASLRAWRISFFDREFFFKGAINGLSPEALLGYADVVSIVVDSRAVECYVRESVIRPPDLLNNYLHVQTHLAPRIAGRELTIRGSYFCQQNGLTGCCAHAGLRCALRNLDVQEEQLTDLHINQLLGIQAKHASEGLTNPQIGQVIESAGYSAFHIDFFNYPDREYAHFVHPFIESGFPALLAFAMEETSQPLHVVTVVGHTLNTDLWYPEAKLGYFVTFPSGKYRRLPSWNWTPDLVVQDDNYGTLLCVSSTCLLKQTLPRLDPRSRAMYGIGLVPQGIRRSPANAEDRAAVLLDVLMRSLHPQPKKLRWLEELRGTVLNEQRAPVLRTLLVSKHNYIQHIEASVDWDGRPFSEPHVLALQQLLPDWVWMVEVSIPNLYTANKTKLGELLIDVEDPDPDPDKDLPSCWVGGRLPGVFFIPRTGIGHLPVAVSADVEAHVPLYRRPELPCIAAEW